MRWFGRQKRLNQSSRERERFVLRPLLHLIYNIWQSSQQPSPKIIQAGRQAVPCSSLAKATYNIQALNRIRVYHLQHPSEFHWYMCYRCNSDGGGDLSVEFVQLKEPLKSLIVTTFHETRISCRQRSFTKMHFKVFRLPLSPSLGLNVPNQMHCLWLNYHPSWVTSFC